LANGAALPVKLQRTCTTGVRGQRDNQRIPISDSAASAPPSAISSTTRHARKPDPWHAVRTRRGPWTIAYRLSFTRRGRDVAKLFRVHDHDDSTSALRAARAWRETMTRMLQPATKQEFSQRVRPANTSRCASVNLKRQVASRGGWSGEHALCQAPAPQGGQAVLLLRTDTLARDTTATRS
jgi:hypothetical protein